MEIVAVLVGAREDSEPKVQVTKTAAPRLFFAVAAAGLLR